MADKLVYSAYTENLVEIAMIYADMVREYQELTEIDSLTWKQQFVDWANEFEEMYSKLENMEDTDYLESIEIFAIEKILEYADIKQEPFYFTFDSWEGFPYQDTYLVVYGTDIKDAVERFRRHYPDAHKNTINCSYWYSQEQWDESVCKKIWKDMEPARVIR